MAKFSVEVERCGPYAVLRTDGYINNLGAEQIEREYDALAAQGVNHVIINFARSPIINSMGLAILLGIIEKNLDSQGQLLFSDLNEVSAETMDMMDLTRYVTLIPTEAEARQMMETRLNEREAR